MKQYGLGAYTVERNVPLMYAGVCRGVGVGCPLGKGERGRRERNKVPYPRQTLAHVEGRVRGGACLDDTFPCPWILRVLMHDRLRDESHHPGVKS